MAMVLALIGQDRVFFAHQVRWLLESLTTKAAKVDGGCAGLTWPASSLVEGLLQSISSLIGVISWVSPNKLVVHLLAIIIQVGMRVFWQPHGMVFFMVARMAQHQELYAVFGFEIGLGSWLAAVLSSVKITQSVFLKFHLLTGLIGTDLMVEEVSMMEGRCCDFGKAVSTRWWVVSSPMFVKARSKLVLVPQRAEWKLRGCLGSSSTVRS